MTAGASIPPGVTLTRAGPGEEHAGHGRARDARGQALGTRSCGGDGPQVFPFFVSDLGIWRHGFDVNIRFTCSFIYSREVDCGPTGRCTLAGDRSQTWQLGRRERGLPRARKGRLAVGPEGGRGGAGAEGSGRPETGPGGPGSRTAYGVGQTRGGGGGCVYPKGFLQERVTVSPPGTAGIWSRCVAAAGPVPCGVWSRIGARPPQAPSRGRSAARSRQRARRGHGRRRGAARGVLGGAGVQPREGPLQGHPSEDLSPVFPLQWRVLSLTVSYTDGPCFKARRGLSAGWTQTDSLRVRVLEKVLGEAASAEAGSRDRGLLCPGLERGWRDPDCLPGRGWRLQSQALPTRSWLSLTLNG